MRILHTSDWHLGHSLHELSRDYEHERFLLWLLDTIESEAVDALIIAGDVFDTANPSAQAQRAWYRFLAEANRRCPDLDIVVIAGNHDSAGRLEAPKPLLEAQRVHVVGVLRRDAEKGLDVDELLAPLHGPDGTVQAWCAAIPFLRSGDLTPAKEGDEEDPLIAAVRATHAEVLTGLALKRTVGQALIATGHCFMVGTELSELSERRILGGNQHALPADLFPEDMTYVALGHLHKAQRVAKRDSLRYSGSPIPLSMSERSYTHQVLIVDIEGVECKEVRPLPIPRQVDFLRVPESGAASLETVIELCAALPARDESMSFEQRPFLEVKIALDAPVADLRARVEAALEDRSPRLVKLGVEHSGSKQALAEAAIGAELSDLEPERVFRKRYHRDHEGDPDPSLLAAFHELLDVVNQEDA